MARYCTLTLQLMVLGGILMGSWELLDMPLKASAAAELLQRRICEAACDDNRLARDWLMIDIRPSAHDIKEPGQDSFIGVCRQLGLDWRWLSDSLGEALRVPEVRASVRVVQQCEPCYTYGHDYSDNEADFNGIGASQIKGRKR